MLPCVFLVWWSCQQPVHPSCVAVSVCTVPICVLLRKPLTTLMPACAHMVPCACCCAIRLLIALMPACALTGNWFIWVVGGIAPLACVYMCWGKGAVSTVRPHTQRRLLTWVAWASAVVGVQQGHLRECAVVCLALFNAGYVQGCMCSPSCLALCLACSTHGCMCDGPSGLLPAFVLGGTLMSLRQYKPLNRRQYCRLGPASHSLLSVRGLSA